MQRQAAWSSYSNTLDGCERGNTIRRVLYSNTRDAVRQERGAGFESQLRDLKQTPGIDNSTGEIDCNAVVEQPSTPKPPGFILPDGFDSTP